jgi:O-antigen ligase
MMLAGSDSGMVGVLAAVVLAVPFIVVSRKSIGRFLMLASSWLGVYTLHTLLFSVMILERRTAGSIVPYIAVFFILSGAGAALCFIDKKKEEKPDGPVKWKPGVILLASIIAAGFAGVEIIGRRSESASDTWRPVYQVRELLHGRGEDTFGSNRLYIWRNTLPSNVWNPVFGNGPDTFGFVFPKQEEAAELYRTNFDKAHNEYLQILICQGILGLLCYLVFLGALFVKAVPKAFKDPLLLAVLAAFTGYCVQAFFNISLPIASQMLWVMAGIIAGICVKGRLPEETKNG